MKLQLLLIMILSLPIHIYCSNNSRSNSPFQHTTTLQEIVATPATNRNQVIMTSNHPSTSHNTPQELSLPVSQTENAIDKILQNNLQRAELLQKLQKDDDFTKKLLVTINPDQLKQAACKHESHHDTTWRRMKHVGIFLSVIGINFPIFACLTSDDFCINPHSSYSYAYLVPSIASLIATTLNMYNHVTTHQIAVPSQEETQQNE